MLSTYKISIRTFSDAHWIIKFFLRHKNNKKQALQRDLVTELEKVKTNIIVKIKQFTCFSQSKLYEHLTVLKTVRWDLLVERDTPGGSSGKAIALSKGCHIVFY